MDTVRICKQCRQPLAENGPEGLCPQCLATAASGAEPAAPEARIPPEVAELAPFFSQLEIIELLGMGGMGMVYKARQPQLDRLVALKILSMDSAPHPSFADRFGREAKALARLNHPGIVAIYDFGQTGPYYYFIMEYVDGMNLRELLATKTITPHQTLDFVVQICTALQYAHEEGVVHRDIKPANILVTKKGQAKIADFGLAKLLGAAPDMALTTSKAAMGTLNYMAPEQRENPQGVDHRADIFSLGVVFYEMLTGEIPMGRFDPPSKKAPVDARLDEVVLRALEREPARRYQEASEIKKGVEAITHFPAARTARGLARLIRNRLGRLAVLVFAAALIIGAAMLWLRPLALSLMDILVPPTTEQRVARARKSLDQFDLEGHIGDAIHQLELAKERASIHTDLADTHALLGLAFWRSYGDTQSIEERTKAAGESEQATNKDSNLAYLVQGLVALDEDPTNLPEAVRLLNRANELYKEQNCEALLGLSDAWGLMKDTNKAALYFAKAEMVSPKHWSDYNNLGSHYYASGNSEAALTNFQRALDLIGDGSPMAWRNLGSVWLYLGKTNEAMRACDRSLKLRPTARACSLKGSILFYENDLSAGADNFLLAADLRPTDYRFRGDAGLVLLCITNRQTEARDNLTRAVGIAEDLLRDNPSCEVQALVGLYRAGLRQTNEADQCLRLALNDCPNNFNVLNTAIEAYIKLGDKPKADPVIEWTLHLAPGKRSALDEAIYAYNQLGETNKADELQKQLDKNKDPSHK